MAEEEDESLSVLKRKEFVQAAIYCQHVSDVDKDLEWSNSSWSSLYPAVCSSGGRVNDQHDDDTYEDETSDDDISELSIVSCSYVTGTSESDRHLSQPKIAVSGTGESLHDGHFTPQMNEGSATYEASRTTSKQLLELIATVHGLSFVLEQCQNKQSASKWLQVMITSTSNTGDQEGTQDVITALIQRLHLLMSRQTLVEDGDVDELLSYGVHSLCSLFYTLQRKLPDCLEGLKSQRIELQSLLVNLATGEDPNVPSLRSTDVLKRDVKVMLAVVESVLTHLECELSKWRQSGLRTDNESFILKNVQMLQSNLSQLLSLFDMKGDHVQSRLRLRRVNSTTPDQMFLVSKLSRFQARIESCTVGLSLFYIDVCSAIWDLLSPIATVISNLRV